VELTELLNAIRAIVGAEHVRPAMSADALGGVQPGWVVEPAAAAQLAQVLASADAAGVHVIPRGGGTKLDWGNPPRGANLLLSTRRLNHILEHAAGDMTATVQAGCTVAAFNDHLGRRGQRLAVDPLWPDRATIGGILATSDFGPLRTAYGPLRDHLIGITVALPDGTLARSGGKVVKNVAGYDLPKLFVGSFGTLGMIVEATFRLYPTPRATQTLCFRVPSHEALGPILATLADCSPVSSAVQIEGGNETPLTIQVLIEGLPGAIEAKTRRVTNAAGAGGAVETAMPEHPCGVRELLFTTPDSAVCKLTLLPTQWPDVLNRVRDAATRDAVRWRIVGQAVGSGLLQLQGSSPIPALTALRTDLASLGCALTVLRCPPHLKAEIDAWPEPGNALPLMRRIKDQFDPKGTLSPGRFVGGI
jgi:glycolate dehydrogenase FAD-binding subunit